MYDYFFSGYGTEIKCIKENMNLRPPAIIFDMDGTLFDSEPLYCAAFQSALEQQGLELDEESYFLSLAGTTVDYIKAFFIRRYGADFDVKKFSRDWPPRFKEITMENGVPFRPGIPELLEWLRVRAVPLAIASSSDLSEIKKFTEASEVDSYFSALAAGDEVSESKPSPEIFLLAAERLGEAPHNCVVVEDSNHGVVGAHAAGMKVIMVPHQVPANDFSKEVALITDDIRSALSKLI